MQEEFLHHLWKFRLFNNNKLQTTNGEELQIINTGEPNSDSGPDFFNARIKIGKTTWAGNVEIHIHASDWELHKHQHDKAYDNVILHVVHEADIDLKRKNARPDDAVGRGEIIPTLELKNRIPKDVYGKYLQFRSSKDWIPCGKQLSWVDKFTLDNWLDRLLVERLERKSQPILDSLKQNKNNWEETFYQILARNFGLKVNSEPFEILARSLPYSVLAKHKNSLVQLEALLFGVAGLLEKQFKDDYPKELQKEFKFLKQKFKLKPIDASLWKFMRLHPPNFPTIRISQLANLIYRSTHLFSKILETHNIASLLQCETSAYWLTHYRFDRLSPLSSGRGAGGEVKRKRLGEESINNILINTIIPFLFIYGKEKGEEKFCDKALALLEKIESENNSIISKWAELGIHTKSAYETQALLQLKNEYCSKKRCLDCAVGAKLLHPESIA